MRRPTSNCSWLARTTQASALVLATVFALGSCNDEAEPAEFEDDTSLSPATTNPDGIAYPSDRLGARARPGDGTAGDRVPNLAFKGYVAGDPTKGLSTISLADYFDPTSARYKVLVLQAAGTWCSICAAEADATRDVAPRLATSGVAFLAIIVSGPTAGRGPALFDVDAWAKEHGTNFALAIDVRARRSEPIGVTGVPWNALVDTRTMEILHSSVGAPNDVAAYAALGLDFVASHPASY